MKKGARSAKTENKGFVWFSLRISFYVMLLLLALSFLNNVIFIILSIFVILLSIFAIIISITHLYIYKRKTFPIIVLIISVLSLLTILFFYVGLLSEVA
ncbi:MAG: hypothetical protein QT10_C0001G0175 [archaeon GW2011_AR19]|nr:MAG: hypothetical protein QT10_C0001G0175 [archaeon GW2011_AR19]